MAVNRPWWRDPFVAFSVAGLALFVTTAWWKSSGESEDRVVVTEVQQAQLRERFERRERRQPSADEMRAEIEAFVDEHVLFEQALAWGLHRSDVVVRRRLLERVRSVYAGLVDMPAEEADLRAVYERERERFREPARVSFRHIFVDQDIHGDGAEGRARELHERLVATGSPPEGDRWYQAPTERLRSLPRIGALMGARFATTLEDLPVGKWSGPVQSGYGYHLVLVSERLPSRLQTFDEAIEEVWTLSRREREQAAFDEFTRRLRADVEVVVESPISVGADVN